jgi:hypothetical protein
MGAQASDTGVEPPVLASKAWAAIGRPVSLEVRLPEWQWQRPVDNFSRPNRSRRLAANVSWHYTLLHDLRDFDELRCRIVTVGICDSIRLISSSRPRDEYEFLSTRRNNDTARPISTHHDFRRKEVLVPLHGDVFSLPALCLTLHSAVESSEFAPATAGSRSLQQ